MHFFLDSIVNANMLIKETMISKTALITYYHASIICKIKVSEFKCLAKNARP